MRLIRAYCEEIEDLLLQGEFVAKLTQLILIRPIDVFYNRDSEVSKRRYATVYQKKLCALFVLEFFLQRQHKDKKDYKNFTDLWNSVFSHFPINYFARERNIISSKVTESIQQTSENNSAPSF